MKFGIFLAPFHRVGEDPTLCFARDMQLIEWLDELGYEEAFIGEHHSSGWEIISSPEIFMAVAATRTRRIMLGSGVVSVPYHHPFHIANRFALLDHLTRGRVMLGCGPGALAADAHMLGIDTTTQRRRMVEGVQAIVRLFTERGGITLDGSYFKLNDAHLQVKPFQQPHMPIFVASTISPSGMVAAGQLGRGVLSVASYAQGGLDDLMKRWAMAKRPRPRMARPWIGAIGDWFFPFISPNHATKHCATSMTAPIAGFRIISSTRSARGCSSRSTRTSRSKR